MSLINHINEIDNSVMVTEGIISDSFRKIVDVFGDACKSTYDWYNDAILMMGSYNEKGQAFVGKYETELKNKSVKGFSYVDYPYDPDAATAQLLVMDSAIYDEISRLNKTIDDQFNEIKYASDRAPAKARQLHDAQFKTSVSRTGKVKTGEVTSLLKGTITIDTSTSEYQRMFLKEHWGVDDLKGLSDKITNIARGGDKKIPIKNFSASSPKVMLSYISDTELIDNMKKNLKTRQAQYNETLKYLERLGNKEYTNRLTGSRVSFKIASVSASFIKTLMRINKTVYDTHIRMRQETLDSFQKTLEQFLKYNPDSSVKESLLEEAYKYI